MHQSSALNPCLISVVMDKITKKIQGALPRWMIFADDIVLIGENYIKLEECRVVLEGKRLRVSRK